MILSQGIRRNADGELLPAWYGQRAWLDDVQNAIVSLDGSMKLQSIHVSPKAVMSVAMLDARTATGKSGGDVGTAHETVARRLRVSKSVVVRARRWLREMGLSVTVAEGRYLTRAERAEAGKGQIRAAATRVLTHPPNRPRTYRRSHRDYPHAERVRTTHRTVAKRSPRRAVDNSPPPMWAQKLAARITERMPWLVRDRHIGNLTAGLVNLALPPGLTAGELLSEIEFHGPRDPSTPIRDPLAWFLHQSRAVAGRILTRWEKPDRPLTHEHRFRAMLGDKLLGCLTCPATLAIT